MARPKKNLEESSNPSLDGMSVVEKAKLLRDQINNQLKKNVIQQYSSDESDGVARLSSGILTLDRILGKGSNGYGWARGRMHGIHGPEGSGKSTIVLSSLVEAQKEGLAVLVDSECVYDPSYAAKVGVDVDSLLVMNPDCAEEAFDTIETLVKSGEVRLVVIDSLDGLIPKAIVQASAEDQFMGVAARINNRFFAKILEHLRKNDCTLIVVSQIREKIGVMYGSPETVNGGRGLKFYATTRVEIRRDSDVESNGNKIGHIAKVMTRKNKAASPQQTAMFRIDWGFGVNKEKCMIDVALSENLITKGGAGWFTLPDGQKIQGEDGLIKEFRNNREFREQVIRRLNDAT